MFFNLPSSWPMVLMSPPTPTNTFIQYAEDATDGQVERAVKSYDSFYKYFKALPNEATGAGLNLHHVYFLVAWILQKQLKF
jgi:hypothetical protein